MANIHPDTLPLRSSASRPSHAARLVMRCRRLAHHLGLLGRWWLKPHVPFQPLFVIATPRSGSNLLIDYLNRLPGVQSHWEILNWGLPIAPSRRASTREALQHIRYSLHTLEAPIRGCKIFLDHLANYRLTLDDLDAAFPQAKYIILYRQSLIEQFASLELARMTKQWSLTEGQQPVRAPIFMEPAALRKYCDHVRRGYQDLLANRWLAERAVLVSYEELTRDPERWLAGEICRLLEVPPTRCETNLKKQNPQPLAERIANFSEIAALAASPLCKQYYAWPRQSQAGMRRAA